MLFREPGAAAARAATAVAGTGVATRVFGRGGRRSRPGLPATAQRVERTAAICLLLLFESRVVDELSTALEWYDREPSGKPAVDTSRVHAFELSIYYCSQIIGCWKVRRYRGRRNPLRTSFAPRFGRHGHKVAVVRCSDGAALRARQAGANKDSSLGKTSFGEK